MQVEMQPGEVVAERYTVTRLLGVGGMGAVYEVEDRSTRRRRALKVMHPTYVANDELRSRFEREAVVAADVKSDHVAEVYDAGVDGGIPYLVLELLDGLDLADLVDEKGPRPLEEVALYLRQAALALDKAHAAGIVHRDLKPENLFLTHADDGTPRIKLLDFGIAKVVEATMSGPQTQGILGTPLYMAPEQMHGSVAVGPRADVCALGHIAYALLVGEPYFAPEKDAHDSVLGMLMTASKGPSEPASTRARARRGIELPLAFDAWFARACHADPEHRFASAGQLAQAFGAMVVGRPTGDGVGMAPAAVPATRPATSVSTTPAPSRVSMSAPTVAQAPAMPASAARGERAALAAGVIVVAAIAAGGIWWGARGPAEEEPVSEGRTAAEPSTSQEEPPPRPSAPSARPPVDLAAPEPPLDLDGRWRSGSGRAYDVVWSRGAWEFRVADPARFPRQGYAAGEPRFRVVPGPTAHVEDRIRPAPPGRRRYTDEARGSCMVTFTELDGTPLTATVSANRVEVEMVAYTPRASMFLPAGGAVTACRDLNAGTATRLRSVLTRVAP